MPNYDNHRQTHEQILLVHLFHWFHKINLHYHQFLLITFVSPKHKRIKLVINIDILRLFQADIIALSITLKLALTAC